MVKFSIRKKPVSISPKEGEVLDKIIVFQSENKYSPTVRDLADMIDKSKSTVQWHLRSLRRKRIISGSKGARTIVVDKSRLDKLK